MYIQKSKLVISLSTCLLLVASLLFITNHHTTAASKQPATPPSGSSFTQRLALRKSERHKKLNKETIAHVQSQCASAQSTIRTLVYNTAPIITNWTATYRKIDAILWVNIGQLKLVTPTLSTFTLEQQHTAYAIKVASFQITAANYQQTLSDLLAINCEADAVGFQALLDTARIYYKNLMNETNDIYNYVVNSTKPVLEGFIPQLQPDGNKGGQ